MKATQREKTLIKKQNIERSLAHKLSDILRKAKAYRLAYEKNYDQWEKIGKDYVFTDLNREYVNVHNLIYDVANNKLELLAIGDTGQMLLCLEIFSRDHPAAMLLTEDYIAVVLERLERKIDADEEKINDSE